MLVLQFLYEQDIGNMWKIRMIVQARKTRNVNAVHVERMGQKYIMLQHDRVHCFQ